MVFQFELAKPLPESIRNKKTLAVTRFGWYSSSYLIVGLGWCDAWDGESDLSCRYLSPS